MFGGVPDYQLGWDSGAAGGGIVVCYTPEGGVQGYLR